MIHIFFSSAASFSSFSGGPNVCPRCNKTVYFGKHGDDGMLGTQAEELDCYQTPLLLCFCSREGVVSGQELAPALPALREMQQDSGCRQPRGGEGLNRTTRGRGRGDHWLMKCIENKSWT